MSRIGKLPIKLPAGVNVEFKDNKIVHVKGPKGRLSQEIKGGFNLSIENNILSIISPSNQQKTLKALHGLYRSLIFNMVKGVTEGYLKTLELVGVGYRAEAKNNIIQLSLGYSHVIYFAVPKELEVKTVTKKGSNPKIILKGIDKQLLGHVSAEIRKLRKPEPYKGKGVRFEGEEIRLKAGKTAAKKA